MAEPLRAPRRKPARRDTSGLMPRMANAVLSAARRNPTLAIALVIFGGLGATTVVNALALQTSRHPAPLFADVTDTRPTRTAAQPGGARLVPPKQAEGFRGQPPRAGLAAVETETGDPFILDLQNELARRGLYTGAIDGRTGAKTEAAIRLYEKKTGLPVTGQPSPLILRKLATSQVAAADSGLDQDPLRGVIQESTPKAPDETARIIRVQQALNALGLGPLEEDGVAGPATRAAIERFERDRKLEPTGEATGRTLRALQRASGIAINSQ